MYRYSPYEMLANDIDWFFKTSDNKAIHAASAGGLIPRFVQKKRNREILIRVREKLDPIYKELIDSFGNEFYWEKLYSEININKESLRRVENQQKKFRSSPEALSSNPKWQKEYLMSFCSMAKCGFISFDRMNIEDCYDGRYQQIADGSQKKIDSEIFALLPEINVSLDEIKNENANWVDLLNERSL